MKLSEQIRTAAKRLTPETWIKGKFFLRKNDVLCMCAHGAMQMECNPHVRSPYRIVSHFNSVLNCAMPHDINGNSDCENWNNRPKWIRTPDPEHGNMEAHYLLGMVGLTSFFNDDPGTTLQDVLEKFEQAAKLAESLGV